VVAALARHHHERDHAQALAARYQRHRHARAAAELAHQAQLLWITREALALVIRYHRVEDGAARAQHNGDRFVAAGVAREALPMLVRHALLLRVRADQRKALHRTVLGEDVDAATVGYGGNGQARQRLERLLEVERGGEERADLHKEAAGPL